jgi:hypothetical protein
VYITGTFNNWERQIPMHRSGNDFTYIHNLPKGKHAFKFIVDDEWRCVGDLQLTQGSAQGRVLHMYRCRHSGVDTPAHGARFTMACYVPTIQAQSISCPHSWVCRYAPDQRTVADMEGRINNFIDVSGFKPFNEDSSTLDIARKEDEVGSLI